MSHLLTITRRFRNTDEFAPRPAFPVGWTVLGLLGAVDVLSAAAALAAF